MKSEEKRKKTRLLFTWSLIVCLIAAFIFSVGMADASPGKDAKQKKKELEEKKKKLHQEIEYKKKLLEEVKGNKSRSMLMLAIVNNKIKDQEELIKTLFSEIGELNSQIDVKKTEIKTAEGELTRLKKEYANMVVMTYKNRGSFDKLMFLFSADDFSQAWTRLKYFEAYTHHRKLRASELEGRKKSLKEKMADLENRKSEQKSLLGDTEGEKKNLTKEKSDKEVLIGDLKKKESELKDEVKRKKLAADNVKKQIDKLIEEELKKYTSKPNKKDPKKPNKISLTPEEELVNTGFEGNQGRLPWPLKEGVITQGFGPYQHPDLKDIDMNNNGVNITTNKGANVRAIYEGEVVVAGSLGGTTGKVIIVKHGEYFSVYQGLDELSVKKGDKVKVKQNLGTILDDDDNKNELHFELYKGKTLLNPENWISKG